MKNMRTYNTLLMLIVAILLIGCNRAPNNVSTLQTTDCGVNWRLIPVGSTIPRNTLSVCSYNTTLPNYPMQGNAEFLTQFKNNVLVKVRIDYDYEITDPVLYIKNAKFLGKMRESVEDGGEANASSNGRSNYETAENVVIDVRLRELTSSATVQEDIVTHNPSAFEVKLLEEANAQMSKRGVTFNSMTYITMPEDQTRMAIDAATAMAVYEDKGMSELGRQLVIARASATRVNVNTASGTSDSLPE